MRSINLRKYLVLILYILCKTSTMNCLFKENSEFSKENLAEDARLTTTQILNKYGYKTETHFATTEDGYILQLHRITASPIKNPKLKIGRRKIVMHLPGMGSSSGELLLRGPRISLAYLLADRDYDVWLTNHRGNRYSRNHTHLSPDDKKFWDFSWHEIGYYDIPCFIDYILNVTKQDNLTYTGISQGGTVFYVFASERPEYSKKVSHAHLAAPAAHLYHQKSKFVKKLVTLTSSAYKWFGAVEILNDMEINHFVAKYICSRTYGLYEFCATMVFETTGYDQLQVVEPIIPFAMGHLPAGVSTKQFFHYAQLVLEDRFGQFDYGKELNLVKYGKTRPPDYNLKTINIPIIIYMGENDNFLQPIDVKNTTKNISTIFEINVSKWKNWTHMDYGIAKDVHKYFYKKLFKVLKLYA